MILLENQKHGGCLQAQIQYNQSTSRALANCKFEASLSIYHHSHPLSWLRSQCWPLSSFRHITMSSGFGAGFGFHGRLPRIDTQQHSRLFSNVFDKSANPIKFLLPSLVNRGAHRWPYRPWWPYRPPFLALLLLIEQCSHADTGTSSTQWWNIALTLRSIWRQVTLT